MIAIAKYHRSGIIIILQKGYYRVLDRVAIKEAGAFGIYLISSDTLRAKLIRKGFLYLTSLDKKCKLLLNFLPFFIYNDRQNNFDFLRKSFSKIFFIKSWNQREHKSCFIENSTFIRELIKPAIEIKDIVASTFSNIREQYQNSIIIAVHIRRGDYREFYNGRYYFEDSVYISYMQELQKLFGKTSLLFYLFSNENICLSNYEGLNIFFKKDQSAISDMWAMSKCDYIIGPPSTFSMWASFWNKSPLYFIQDAMKTLSLDNFKTVIAQDIFEGHQL